MIRLINRTLIIPRGDTGEFTIPTQGTVEQGDIAILSIYDPLTRTTVCEKVIPATNETLTFAFTHQDTVGIEPADRYEWDIKLYHAPVYEDNQLIGGAVIDSYYAAFSKKMPQCIIKQVAQNV